MVFSIPDDCYKQPVLADSSANLCVEMVDGAGSQQMSSELLPYKGPAWIQLCLKSRLLFAEDNVSV